MLPREQRERPRMPQRQPQPLRWKRAVFTNHNERIGLPELKLEPPPKASPNARELMFFSLHPFGWGAADHCRINRSLSGLWIHTWLRSFLIAKLLSVGTPESLYRNPPMPQNVFARPRVTLSTALTISQLWLGEPGSDHHLR